MIFQALRQCFGRRWFGSISSTSSVRPPRRARWQPRLEELESRLTPSQIGVNDFRISHMGPEGDVRFDAEYPSIAYNSNENQYFAVWIGDDTTDNEYEVFGQLLDSEGRALGPNVRISNMGPDGDGDSDASSPAVVYNSADNEFLVVWSARMASGEQEIFGQRLDGSGQEIGVNDFRISQMGPDGDTAYSARLPAVALDTTHNRYLVVWSGHVNADDEEIVGQLLDAAGAAIGGATRLSDMGPDGNRALNSSSPDVAWNATTGEYLVVWWGDDVADSSFQIFGQRLDAMGVEVGENDFAISSLGPDNDPSVPWYYSPVGSAYEPKVAWNGTDNEYLVVWHGVESYVSLHGSQTPDIEIYAQRLNAMGNEIGVNDMRISNMGPRPNGGFSHTAVGYNPLAREYLVVWAGGGESAGVPDWNLEILGQRLNANPAAFGEVGGMARLSNTGPDSDDQWNGFLPALAFNSSANEFLVAWGSDDHMHSGAVPNVESEIFGQRFGYTAQALEVGVNDFRISRMGPEVGGAYGAFVPAVAYNSTDNQYLVVWDGDHTTNGENEIFGRLLDAATGRALGADFRISDMGPDGNTAFDAFEPAVAYNVARNEYLVVWYGEDNTGALVADEYEIFAQRLDAAGHQIGVNDFRISDMGPDGDTRFAAESPDLVYNAASQEFLVVWHGSDNAGALVEDEYEIYGQRLDVAGNAIGANDFRISDMGTDGDDRCGAFNPAVAWNSSRNEYLVVWDGNDTSALGIEDEIYGQRLDAAGAPMGVNDFRISDMGPDGQTLFHAWNPDVAANSIGGEYLVVWEGNDAGETEIFGQRLTAMGSEIGVNDFRISNIGPDGDADYSAKYPAVEHHGAVNEYLVVWDTSGWFTSPANATEIHGQRLNADPAEFGEVGSNDFRLSDMGLDDEASYAVYPALAVNHAGDEVLIVWEGNDNSRNEYEVYGQRFAFNVEVNDAPTGVNDTLASVTEDSPARIIPLATLLANDTAGSDGEDDQVLTIIALSNVVGGTATLASDHVVFTPAANYHGPAGFTYTLEDDGTTAGVADPKTSSASVSFNFTPVDDAPVMTMPKAPRMKVNSTLRFTGSNRLSVADADVGAGMVRVTLMATRGSLRLPSTAGLAKVWGNGRKVIITGSLPAINATLNRLRFKPAAGFRGKAKLTAFVTDLGINGQGISMADFKTVAISVV
ncbi:MAG: Ig-like domain-containing protein [Gemmataceae bacterium]|nr:Ig-like domain-containing protein [Gemmataceae bacterium]